VRNRLDDDHDHEGDGTPSPATTAATAATTVSGSTTAAPATTTAAAAEAAAAAASGTDGPDNDSQDVAMVDDNIRGGGGGGRISRSAADGNAGVLTMTAQQEQQDAFVRFAAPIFLYEEEDHEEDEVDVDSNDEADDGRTTSRMDIDDDHGDETNGPDSPEGALSPSTTASTPGDTLKEWVQSVVAWQQYRHLPAPTVAGSSSSSVVRAGPEVAAATATASTTSRRAAKSKYRTLPSAASSSSSSRHNSKADRAVKRIRPAYPCDLRPAKKYKLDHALREYWLQHNVGGGGGGGVPPTIVADWRQQRGCNVALVNLCGGRARSAYRHSKRTKALVTAGSASWRDAVAFSAPVAYGDFRKYQHPPLVYATATSPPVPVPLQAAASEWADAKVAASHNASVAEWKALMELGQNLIDDLKTVTLSEVTQFCRCVSRVYLPPPDTTELNQQMDSIVVRLLGAVESCRSDQAYIVDAMFSDPDDNDDDGVDTNELQRLISAATGSAPCVLDWADEQRRAVDSAVAWERRVEQALAAERFLDVVGGVAGGELEELERLVEQAMQTLSFRPTTLVALEQRIVKAYELRTRSCALFDNTETRETLKALGSTVRDATKLRVTFPEARRLIECHVQAEAWVDRANVAIRSRISLTEIKELLRRADDLPVDLSEFTEKLLARVRTADEWLLRFSNIVPDASVVEQMSFVRKLMEIQYGTLHELASDGSRIPVEVETVSWLQVELDGRNWSLRTKKMIPGYDDSKKGRLEELQEHLSKAVALRDRLANVLSEGDKHLWSLDGEAELRRLVEDTERWFSENKDFIDGDNRKSGKRPSLSIPSLRLIVEKGNAIYALLGSALNKMSRILLQAEDWLETHRSLVTRCETGDQVEVSELMNAVSSANSDVALDLHEAQELGRLSEKVRSWFEAAEVACGRRKPSRNKKGFTIESLKELMAEAKGLPVDTSAFERELTEQLRIVEDWQARSAADIEQIIDAYEKLRASLVQIHGEPTQFVCKPKRTDASDDIDTLNDETKCADDATISSAPSSVDQTSQSEVGESNVVFLVSRFLKDAQALAIRTPESEVAQELDAVCKFLSKSVKYLESHRDVFDKRFFGAFDRSMAEAKELLEHASQDQSQVLIRLRESWVGVVKDQAERLSLILQERERYTAWCKMVNTSIEEGKLSLERLRDIAAESRGFPVSCDTTRKVQRLEERALQWTESVGQQLSSGEKIPLQDAKVLLDEGDKLGVLSAELKALRSAVKAANGWANRVRRCKPESGNQNSKTVQELLEEHESLLVCMPEEVKKLRKALKAFCICRRPYDGFMVGCDSCDDWFHGPCMGISESKADKVDKYECVRCLLVKVFETSAATIAGVIKKWTNVADCKKARQNGSQKLQRKLRKELKEMEDLNERRKLVKEEIRLAESQPVLAPPETEESGPTAAAEAVGDDEAPPADIQATEQDLEVPFQAVSDVEGTVSLQSLHLKLVGIEKSLLQCESRLGDIHVAIARRRNEEEIEDANADLLRRFCVVVRSVVLIPETASQAEAGRPTSDGDLSSPMKNVIEQAQAAGLERFQDVQDVINAFRCMCWSHRARDVLSKHPQFEDVHSLVRRATDSSMRLPDEKALRILRGLSQRAAGWQIRVMKAIAPVPGETRRFDVNHLRELSKIGEDIPLCMPFEARLAATIDDNGNRHCICGGPSDGRLMLSCDACERWFHCSCIGLSKDGLDGIEEWKCTSCSNTVLDPPTVRVEEFHNQFDFCSDDSSETDEESTSHSVYQRELWPPYGLLGAEKALNAIGQAAASVPPLFEIQGPGANSPAPTDHSESLRSPSAQLPQAGVPPHPYSPTQHYFQVTSGPFGSLNPGASSAAFATASTPPRVSAMGSGPGGGFHQAPSTPNQPVVFGSPGVTVLSPGAVAGDAGHHTVYAAAAGTLPSPFANIGHHYPHASHPLFHYGHVPPHFHTAFLAGYAGSAPAFADAAAAAAAGAPAPFPAASNPTPQESTVDPRVTVASEPSNTTTTDPTANSSIAADSMSAGPAATTQAPNHLA
jgi:PLU-1-like protein/PHD-finger